MPVSRRKFLATTTGAAAITPFIKMEKPIINAKPGFQLKILATNWGFDGSYDAFCAKAKAEGYDGAELWLPGTVKEREEMMNAFSKHGLAHAFLCGSGDADFSKNIDQFEKMLRDGVAYKPLYFNCHSGKDFFNFEQGSRFVQLGLDVSKSSSVPVYHETHRGRLMFAAQITKQYLEAFPGLRLTLDVSHWCNVHESLLSDQPETMTLALSRTEHIHARIGHAEGPQVNDPRAPEWADAVKAHYDWWDEVVKRKAAAGQTMTILTEFGPPTYLPTVPYTFQPLADQWDINVYMMKTLRDRYK
ncbi:MAG: sugar phosphate isomerase/epimerase [Saprospiraceae bacterium]|nr:sugar phosphate isomerase/epimerase [Saprospiraceae bacterium]